MGTKKKREFTTENLAHAVRIAASLARQSEEPNPAFIEALLTAATFFDGAPSNVKTRSHPEDFCHKCGRPNAVWFAPSPLWNKAVREKGEPGILCPVCFIELAERADIKARGWVVLPARRDSGFKTVATEVAEWIGIHPKWSRESVTHTIAAAMSDAVMLDRHTASETAAIHATLNVQQPSTLE